MRELIADSEPSDPGSGNGSWWNETTGESLHPDLHNATHGPHYDFNVKGSGSRDGWRYYEDTSMVAKGDDGVPVTSSNPGTKVPLDIATAWVRDSLTRGRDIARSLRHHLDDFSEARVCASVDESAPLSAIDDTGAGYDTAVAHAEARALLAHAYQQGLQTLIVEDELCRPGSKWLDDAANIAYATYQVFHWISLADSGAAEDLMCTASFGYPLNAYACREDAATLGLVPRTEMSPEVQTRILNDVELIIVSAFDKEGYVALLTPGLADATPSAP